MEFNEKLQELRKSKSLTQEELAEALFVSRTAISKWEQGRGYPSIDSLKEISRFFSVSIDDLICSEEIISAAADEKKECVEKYISLICNTLDIFLALLLFLPVFGNGTDHPVSVSLYAITGLSTWTKTVFAALISLTALNGICGVIINHFDKPVWNRHRLMTGMVLSVACVAVFILTRQPYAGIICLAVLVAKGFMVARGKGLL
jgi:transcriptional regulator with XRE-family HTH domain